MDPQNAFYRYIQVWIPLVFFLCIALVVARVQFTFIPLISLICTPIALFLLRHSLHHVTSPNKFSIYAGLSNVVLSLPYAGYGSFLLLLSIATVKLELNWFKAAFLSAAIMLAPPVLWAMVGFVFAKMMISAFREPVLQKPLSLSVDDKVANEATNLPYKEQRPLVANPEDSAEGGDPIALKSSDQPVILTFVSIGFFLNLVIIMGLMNESILSGEGSLAVLAFGFWFFINMFNILIFVLYARRRSIISLLSLLTAILFLGIVGFVVWLIHEISQISF
jgi:hypothetical protein